MRLSCLRVGISHLRGSRCFRAEIVRWLDMILLDILATLMVMAQDGEWYNRLFRIAQKLYKGSKWRY